MAVVQAAFQAVMARGPRMNNPEPPASAPPVSGFKRNAGRSKLSKIWGPDDLTDDVQVSASVPPSAATESAPEPTAVITTTSKTGNIKKGRASSVPACPVCEQAAVHPRSECPVVAAGAPSLRRRITQLKESGGDHSLIAELSLLLKEVHKRRRTVATPSSVNSVPFSAATASSGDVPPSSPEQPLQSLSAIAPRRPSLPHRRLSSPRLPAGSEISEVAVESKDEGSSNESSSSDDEGDVPPPPPPTGATIPDPASLEALLWGPSKPRASILAGIPSESESDDESNDSKDESLDLEEEEKNDLAYRRLSRKLERAASSSDDEPGPEPEPADPDMDVDDIIIPPTTMDPDPNDSIEVRASLQALRLSEVMRL